MIGVKRACNEYDPSISIRTVEKWRSKIKKYPLYYVLQSKGIHKRGRRRKKENFMKK